MRKIRRSQTQTILSRDFNVMRCYQADNRHLKRMNTDNNQETKL